MLITYGPGVFKISSNLSKGFSSSAKLQLPIPNPCAINLKSGFDIKRDAI